MPARKRAWGSSPESPPAITWIQVMAGGDSGLEPHALFLAGIHARSHEHGGFQPVRHHAVELDARGHAAHVLVLRGQPGDAPIVVDSVVESVRLIAPEIVGTVDLQVPEAVANRALAQPPEHEGKETAH